MFDIGWSELVVIGVVALIAIGPKELPGVLRTFGQYMGKIRRMASEFQGQFQEAMREAEMADLKQSLDEVRDAAKGFTAYDPLASVKSELHDFAADPLGQSAATAPPSTPSPEPAASTSLEVASAPAAESADVTLTTPAAASIGPDLLSPEPSADAAAKAVVDAGATPASHAAPDSTAPVKPPSSPGSGA